MANVLPQPIAEPIVSIDREDVRSEEPGQLQGFIGDTWSRFFNSLAQAVSQSPNRVVSPVSLTGQNASIATTSLAPGQVAAGLYRISYYARITTVGTVSSSLTVTIGWTDHGITQSWVGKVLNTNTTTTYDTATLMVYSDNLTPVTYATTYASNIASSMNYELFLTFEALAI